MTKKKDPKDFLKQGAPTKYREDLPKKLIEYFSRPLYEIKFEAVVTKLGMQEIPVEKPTEFPSIEGFCSDLFISKSTFHEWVKKYPDFTNAYGFAKMRQKKHLVEHGLQGNYNSAFAKFLAINCTDLVDKVVTEHQGNIEINIDNDDSAL